MTWNPVTGCTKVSPGCLNCYAERMAKRLQAMRAARYVDGFNLRMHEDALTAPLRWKSPRKVFVNSMSDLFHQDVSMEFIQRVFDIMRRCPQHQFQLLTKRAVRLRALANRLDWAPNIWMGVSVEDARRARRARELALIPAHVRFLSVEPLLGPIDDLPLDDIHWVIVGGSRGPARDPCNPTGLKAFANSARPETSRSFSRSGAGCRNIAPAAS